MPRYRLEKGCEDDPKDGVNAPFECRTADLHDGEQRKWKNDPFNEIGFGRNQGGRSPDGVIQEIYNGKANIDSQRVLQGCLLRSLIKAAPKKYTEHDYIKRHAEKGSQCQPEKSEDAALCGFCYFPDTELPKQGQGRMGNGGGRSLGFQNRVLIGTRHVDGTG